MTKLVFRLYFDYEKEEAWLNKMAREGWMLKSFFLGFFRFVKDEPGKYIYRIELLPHHFRSPKNKTYFDFLKDMDVEIISFWVLWVIYRRKTDLGPFDIYSDIESRITHYGRISRFLLPLGLIEVGCAIYMVFSLSEKPEISELIILSFALIFAYVILSTALKMQGKRLRLIKEKQVLESID